MFCKISQNTSGRLILPLQKRRQKADLRTITKNIWPHIFLANPKAILFSVFLSYFIQNIHASARNFQLFRTVSTALITLTVVFHYICFGPFKVYFVLCITLFMSISITCVAAGIYLFKVNHWNITTIVVE